MTVLGEAYIEIRPKTDGFERETTSRVAGIAKKAAGLFAGAFALREGFNFARGLVDEAEEARKVVAQTNAVIASTGGVANVSAAQIDKLANSISRKTGIDDEEIAKASDLLLTFTGVRNEVGKGNDIFNRATSTLVDMGKALGTDAAGSAIQLGKALNDPTAGLSALTRVGVTFTDQQKEQIETMQAAGDMAGAQRVILDELAKEFGGSAAAQATAGDRLKVVYGNIREELGAKLLPVVDRVGTFLADRLPGALEFLGDVGAGVLRVLRPIAETVAGVIGPVVRTIADFAGSIVAGIRDAGSVLDGLALGIASFFNVDALDPRIQAFRDTLGSIVDVVGRVVAVVRDNLRPILIGVGTALAVILSPALAVAGALVFLYTRFSAVRDIANAALRIIVDVAKDVVTALAPIVERIGRFIGGIVDTLTGVGDIGAGLVVDVAGLFGIVEDDPRLEGFFKIVERIEDVIGSLVGFISRNLKPILIGLAAAFLVVTSPVTAVVAALVALYVRFGVVRDVVAVVARVIVTALGAVAEFVATWGPRVAGFLGDVFGKLFRFGSELAPQIAEAIGHVVAVIAAVGSVIGSVIGRVVDVALGIWHLFGDDLLRTIKVVWDEIASVVEFAIALVSGIIRTVVALINGDWGAAWEAIKNTVKEALEFVGETIVNVGRLILSALGTLWQGITTAAGAAWDGFKALASAALGAVVDLVTGLPGRIVGLAGAVGQAALGLGKAVMDGIGAALGAAVEFAGSIGKTVANALIGFINDKIVDSINRALEFDLSAFGVTIKIDPPDIPRIPKLASGGIALARDGGTVVNVAEAGRDEAIIPLPPGLVEGLAAIAAGGVGPLVGQLVVPVEPGRSPYATGVEVVRALRAAQYRLVGR